MADLAIRISDELTRTGVYRWAAIHSRELPEEIRTMGEIYAEAQRRGWLKPPLETERFFEEKLSNKGFGVVAVTTFDYKPVDIQNSEPLVFGICRMSDGSGLLGAWSSRPDWKWVDDDSAHDVDWIFLFRIPR